MGKGKKDWEKKYEEYSNPSSEFQKKLRELEEKYENNTMGRDEYSEYKKLTAIKNNLPKVKNILDLKAKLQEKIDELEAEISARNEIEGKEKENQKLEQEMEKLQLEAEQLENENKKLRKALDAGNLSDKQIETVNKRISENEGKLQTNMQKRQENNVKFGDNHEIISSKKAEQEKNGKFKDMSLEEMKNELTETYQKRSICNVACTNLMEGRSWSSVEVAINEYKNKRFVAKGPEAKKMQHNKEAAKAEAEKETKKVGEKTETEKEENNKENLPANLTGWQKFKNAIKNWWAAGFEEVENKEPDKDTDSDKNTDSDKETKTSLWQRLIKVLKRQKDEKVKNEPEPDKAEPTSEPEKTVSKHDEFASYLKFVAENGVNIDPAEKAKEDEINATIKRLLDKKKEKAAVEGEKVTKTQLKKWEKTARSVAENSYKQKHPARETVEKEGTEVGE